MKTLITAATILALLAGCSAMPEKIQATAAPKDAYSTLSCRAMEVERNAETKRLVELSARQNIARQKQGGAAVMFGLIGVLATQKLDNAPAIASSKGKITALDKRLLAC